MSSDYYRIAPTFWSGRTGRDIVAGGPEAVVMALYLTTNAHASPLGLYHLPIAYAVHDTGLSQEKVAAALEHLARVGYAQYDAEASVVGVWRMAFYQLGTLRAADKRARWVSKQLPQLPRCSFLEEFKGRLALALDPTAPSEAIEAPTKPHASPIEGASEPHRSQQHQHQQQQQQQEEPTPSASAPPKPGASGSTKPTKTPAMKGATTAQARAVEEVAGRYQAVTGRPMAPTKGDYVIAAELIKLLTHEELMARWGELERRNKLPKGHPERFGCEALTWAKFKARINELVPSPGEDPDERVSLNDPAEVFAEETACNWERVDRFGPEIREGLTPGKLRELREELGWAYVWLTTKGGVAPDVVKARMPAWRLLWPEGDPQVQPVIFNRRPEAVAHA